MSEAKTRNEDDSTELTLPSVATEDDLEQELEKVIGGNSTELPTCYLGEIKEETGISKGDLTLTTTVNDPLNVGSTNQQHRKAKWAALLWKHSVANRSDKIHGRGIHYVAISTGIEIPSPNPDGTDWDVYLNSKTCYKYLSDALGKARILGYIPQDRIIDKKSESNVYKTSFLDHDTPDKESANMDFGAYYLPSVTTLSTLLPTINPNKEAYAKWGESQREAGYKAEDDTYKEKAIRMFTKNILDDLSPNPEIQQPYHIEIWSEKTIPKAVKEAAKDAGCRAIIEGQGCMSLTQAFEFGRRVEKVEKPSIVLYLSDFDPAGDKMATQVANKFEWLKQNPRINLPERIYVDKLALTNEQVEDHDLPRQMLDTDGVGDGYASQMREFKEKYGAGATELNALETDLDIYKQIVVDGIEQYRSNEINSLNKELKERYREEVEKSVAEAVDDTEVTDHIPDFKSWMDRYEDKYSEVRPIKKELEKVNEKLEDLDDELSDLKDEDAYTDFKDAHKDIRNQIDVPEADVPEADVPDPDDPLYDSDREYIDTVNRVKSNDEQISDNAKEEDDVIHVGFSFGDESEE